MSWSQLCFQHHPAQSQAWRGCGRSYRRVTVCTKYSCEQICKNQCWVSSSGKVEMGDIFGTFISTYKDSYQEEERAPPILESGRCATLLPHQLPLCFLNRQAHSSLWTFPLAIPTLWELCSHSSWNSCHTLASVSQLKEHLRKVCIGCPVWDNISQRPCVQLRP